MRILITNIALTGRTGTELYARDLAFELLRRGHTPVVYTGFAGLMSDEIKAGGVQVLEHPQQPIEPPDVIHGHHRQTTMRMLLRFPGVPGIFLCHDAASWQDVPALMPRLRRYVAVDYLCRERLIREGQTPQDKTVVVHNFVDLKRFLPRRPLPEKPKRALVFSNYATESTQLPAIRTACARAGLELDIIGSGVGCSVARPEDMLGQYDVVFAKAKAALEAMAVGTAVVLCDFHGVGPMVSSGEFSYLRDYNFGRHLLREPLEPEPLLKQLAKYDRVDAAKVRDQVRACASVETAVDKWLAIYSQIIEEQKSAAVEDDLFPAYMTEEIGSCAHGPTRSACIYPDTANCWTICVSAGGRRVFRSAQARRQPKRNHRK